jgi:GTP-sensing pleiotropic transcriptional regulator CodY
MHINEVMQVVTMAMKVTESVKPDDKGLYRLYFDGKMPVDFSVTRKGDLIIAGVLRQFSDKNIPKDDYLTKVLGLATQFFQTEKECISYDSDTNRILMYRRLRRSEVTQQNILESLEGLLNNMEIWVTTFSAEKEGSHPSSSSIFLTP